MDNHQAITPPSLMPLVPASIADNKELEAVLSQLSYNQLRFAVAVISTGGTKAEAARSIGIPLGTMEKWPDTVDQAIRLLALDAVSSARAIMRHALTQAMMVKVAGLQSDNERIRQAAASEIIEWQLGRAKQQLDVAANVTTYDHRESVFRKLFKDDPGADSTGAISNPQ